MYSLVTMSLVFMTDIFVHLIWCRFQKEDRLHIRSFFAIAAGGLLFLLLFIQVEAGPDGKSFWSTPLWGCALLLYVLLVPVYLIFYFGTKVESPSRLLMMSLKEKDGMTFEEITAVIDNDRLIRPRLDDLFLTEYIREEGGLIWLTAPGVRVAQWLELYQKLSGRGWGG